MRVGRIVKLLIDGDRRETLSSVDEERKVIISIFYPIDSSWNPDRQALYSDLFKPSQERFINAWIGKGVDEAYIRSLNTNIYNDAPADLVDNKYPVILYSPGCTFDRDSAVFVIEKLVNEGYIVITIGALYETEFTILPNGEVIEMAETLNKDNYTYDEWYELTDIRKKDIIFILNQLDNLNNTDLLLKGKLDLDKIGIMGFSLGAVSVFEVAAEDKRIKAVVLFEGCMFYSSVDSKIKRGERLSTPLMLLKRHDCTYQQMVDKTKGWFEDLECNEFKEELKLIEDISKTQEQLYEYLDGYKSFVKINFSDHPSFSDYYLLANEKYFEYCGGENNVEKVHEIINEATIRFFNEFIRNKVNEYQEFVNIEKRYQELKIISSVGEIA
jgi:hypothetical protein